MIRLILPFLLALVAGTTLIADPPSAPTTDDNDDHRGIFVGAQVTGDG